MADKRLFRCNGGCMNPPVDLGAWLPLISIVTSAVGATAAYYGARSAMLVQMARIEEQFVALKARVDSDHAELDELRETVYKLQGAKSAN